MISYKPAKYSIIKAWKLITDPIPGIQNLSLSMLVSWSVTVEFGLEIRFSTTRWAVGRLYGLPLGPFIKQIKYPINFPEKTVVYSIRPIAIEFLN